MTETFSGRCLCGAVRYRCGPLLYPATLCHCESCRRATGAHAVGWLTVRPEDLLYEAGTPREFQSTPGIYRSFCERCGTPLTYRSVGRTGEIDVTIGSLEDAGRVVPVDHLWMQDAVAWDRPGDGLPQHPARRPE